MIVFFFCLLIHSVILSFIHSFPHEVKVRKTDGAICTTLNGELKHSQLVGLSVQCLLVAKKGNLKLPVKGAIALGKKS